MRPARRPCLACVAAVALFGAADTATAAVPDPGTFSISPSRQNVVGRPPVSLASTLVKNTTKQPYDVQVTPVLLSQNLTGAFTFSEQPGALRDALMVLRPLPARFRLAPGQSRTVVLRWLLLPRAKRAAYVGVLFRGQARDGSGRSIPVVTRLLSTNFLRVPGRYDRRGALTALHVGQFAPGTLRVVPRVANTGDVIGAPTHGRLAIRNARGKTVYRTRWTADVVLPGAARDVPIDLHTRLPAGRYTAVAAMTFGSTANAKRTTRFTLVAPNTLPTPAIAIDGFAAHGQAGRHPTVSGVVRSVGTAPASLAMSISIYRVTNGLPDATALATAQVRDTALAPGSRRPFVKPLAVKLVPGQYHVVADYTDATGAPQQLTSDFAAVRPRSLIDRIRLYITRHELLLTLLAAGAIIAVILLTLGRRQRRLQAELRDLKGDAGTTPTPTTTPPPP